MLPKIYQTKHPRTPWLVVYSNPAEKNAQGQPKKVQRWFAQEADALAHHGRLIEAAATEGTAGLAFDFTLREDAIAARRALNASAWSSLTLAEVVRAWLLATPAHRPHEVEIAPLFAEFLTAKEHEDNRRPATVRNLRNRVRAWLTRQKITTLGAINEASVRALKQRPGVTAQTRLTDMTAVSSFCGWLVERKHLAQNPLIGITRPQTDHVVPRALRAAQATALLEAARQAQGGRLLRAFVLMLLAGLRPGEVERIDPKQIDVSASRPLLRIHTGKRRRLIRILPLSPAFVAWWKIAPAPKKAGPVFEWGRDRWAHARILEKAGLVERATPAGKITRSDWQADILRHTYISWRMTVTRDENLVALEAGTSAAIIHAHYLALMTTAEARAISALRPKKLTRTAGAVVEES